MRDEKRRCASCDIELEGETLVVDGTAYCCAGCAQGGPCVCTYEGDQGRYPRNGHQRLLAPLDLFGEGA